MLEADQNLEAVTNDLSAYNEEIESLENELQNQKKMRRQLRERKLTLEEILGNRATDVAIFRAVQSQLLRSEKLANSAIAVNVDEGIVTISGFVDSQSKKQDAFKVAESIPGVKVVRSYIQAEESSADQTIPAN